MVPTLRYRIWSVARWLIALFVALFVFRLIHGFAQPAVRYDAYSDDIFSNLTLRKNYASEKGYAKNEAPAAPSFSASQKYERTATTRSRSTAFEKDQDALQARIKEYAGVVQYEQRNGNPGTRQLHLLIGVDPERFDAFYTAVQGIGHVRFTEVTKVDKTNEYRQLNAKRTSLEKTLASLNELKASDGKISDHVELLEKIRGIESELQELGVELGNFDTENEFCSVRFSLYEGAVEQRIGMVQRLKVALEWTLQYYALSIVCLALGALAALLLVVLADKLRSMADKRA